MIKLSLKTLKVMQKNDSVLQINGKKNVTEKNMQICPPNPSPLYKNQKKT